MGPQESGTDRGQTTQDFAIGVGIFLLAVVFVVTFLPSVLAPFDAADGTERAAQAERIAANLVADASVDGERVVLDADAFDVAIEALEDPDGALVPPARSVNVTLESFGGETIAAGGDPYDGGTAGTWVRIVSTDAGCEDGCRLVVRVW